MGILGKRAVIAGGSMAGMLAARVLSDFFAEVIVLDRDNIADQPSDRPMTPQSRHVHILLKGGELALNEFLPGISQELTECGSVQINMSREMINANPMARAEPWEAGITLQSQSRALLEHQVRKRVSACTFAVPVGDSVIFHQRMKQGFATLC